MADAFVYDIYTQEVSMTTRSIPPWVADVLQELELERPTLVTAEDLRNILMRTGNQNPDRLVAKALVDRGWLLPTGVAGVWEFARGELAGPHSTNEPFLTLLAAQARRSDLEAAAALESALWLHSLIDRAPKTHAIVTRTKVRPIAALRRAYRITRTDQPIETETLHGVPTTTVESTLIQMAARPTDVENWVSVLEALPELIATIDKPTIERQLSDLSHAVQARFAYLISGSDPEWADHLDVPRRTVVWFGDRNKPHRRYSNRWNIVDTALPRDPGASVV
jgi:predicted transcriptional regulator of viral defense system